MLIHKNHVKIKKKKNIMKKSAQTQFIISSTYSTISKFAIILTIKNCRKYPISIFFMLRVSIRLQRRQDTREVTSS